MKILVFGAGVIGSLFAVKLHEAGHDVTVVARNQRALDIKKDGLHIQEVKTGKQSFAKVKCTETIFPEVEYDLIMVVIRKEQLHEALPIVAKSNPKSKIIFMVNNPLGYEEIFEYVSKERVMIGFPGAGGTRDGNHVLYTISPAIVQPTTVGEIDGQLSGRIHQIAETFKKAGFPVAISSNIDAWQKTHVAWISPIANAIYAADGDLHKLSKQTDILKLLVQAVREGFSVLKKLGHPVTPAKLKVWQWVPEIFLVGILKVVVKTKFFENIAAKHALSAKEEMKVVASEFDQLIEKSGISAPTVQLLNSKNC